MRSATTQCLAVILCIAFTATSREAWSLVCIQMPDDDFEQISIKGVIDSVEKSDQSIWIKTENYMIKLPGKNFAVEPGHHIDISIQRILTLEIRDSRNPRSWFFGSDISKSVEAGPKPPEVMWQQSSAVGVFQSIKINKHDFTGCEYPQSAELELTDRSGRSTHKLIVRKQTDIELLLKSKRGDFIKILYIKNNIEMIYKIL